MHNNNQALQLAETWHKRQVSDNKKGYHAKLYYKVINGVIKPYKYAVIENGVRKIIIIEDDKK